METSASESLAHASAQQVVDQPLYSICIPQHERPLHLLEQLKRLARQSFGHFEVCIADDCSRDPRMADVKAWLSQSGLAFRWFDQPRNLRYDGNLRAAIGLAQGRYCLLCGNDDGLIDDDTLARLSRVLEDNHWPEVLIANFRDAGSGHVHRRILRSGPRGAGALAAVQNFRHLSFVSGLLIDRRQAQALATDRYDGSEMYQMLVFTRAIAAGARVYGLDEVLVERDLEVPGEQVDRFSSKPRVWPCPIEPRPKPMTQIPELIAYALEGAPQARAGCRSRIHRAVLGQLYRYTYGFWLFEYRRVQSWRYAVGVGLALAPHRIANRVDLGAEGRLRVWLQYLLMMAAGLLVPLAWFERIKPHLYRYAKQY